MAANHLDKQVALLVSLCVMEVLVGISRTSADLTIYFEIFYCLDLPASQRSQGLMTVSRLQENLQICPVSVDPTLKIELSSKSRELSFY